MKLMNMKAVAGQVALAWLLALCLALAGATTVWAESATDEAEASQEAIVGSFDGVDVKAQRIWVDDWMYLLDASVKVKGTATKLGLLSDIKQGERIRLRLLPNSEEPNTPYVTLIERL
jgi:hypothetical protein